MAKSLWGVRRRKRPILPGFADRKRAVFFAAAVRRYAWQDYERVGVRELAGYAGVSADTFYDRFGSQRAFWYAVATAQFQAAIRATDREFDLKTWAEAAPETIVRPIARHVVSGMTSDTIGITRMAVRLAMTAPKAAEAFHEYRTLLTERAVKLLAPKLKFPDREEVVRQAMRAVLAMAADTSWRHTGPLLRHERESMINDLTGLMCRSLGISTIKPGRSTNAIEERETEPAMIAIFREALQDSDLPIYGRNLKAFEKAVNDSRKPKVTLSGRFIDPEDAHTVSLMYEQPKPRERGVRKVKRRFRLL